MDYYADDPAPSGPIDLEKFMRVMTQGRAALATLSDLSEQRRGAKDKLQKLEFELEGHPSSEFARFPPRTGLEADIAAARQRLAFLDREIEKASPSLTSRISIARACVEYCRRRGITEDLERRQTQVVSTEPAAAPGPIAAAAVAPPAAPPIVPDAGPDARTHANRTGLRDVYRGTRR